MAALIFPDNTVLVNFASVRRLGLLQGWLRDRGRWTDAVAFEASRSADYWPELRGLKQAGWLGEPIETDDPGAVAGIDHLRRIVFGGSVDEPLKHLGESQTCYLLMNDPRWTGSWWVSDDRDACEFARNQGITTQETIDVIKSIIADGDLTAQQGFDLLHEMDRTHDRTLTLPDRPVELLS